MIKRWLEIDIRRFLKRLLLVATCIALPVIAWAQWTTSSNNIYNSNSGNVGIGTSSPGYKLQISGSQLYLTNGGNTELMTTNTDGGVTGGIQSLSNQSVRLGSISNYPVELVTNNVVGLSLTTTGKVGIGTGSPSTTLEVEGDVTVSGNISAKYQDVAEWVLSRQVLSPGTVVALDTESDDGVIRSSIPYDTHVAGVVSDRPGIVLGQARSGKVKVATTGRVKVRVDTSNGPIHRGDLLVTGTKEGVAMRSETVNVGGIEFHRPGTLIGKALQPLNEGEGEILVLLSLQ